MSRIVEGRIDIRPNYQIIKDLPPEAETQRCVWRGIII